MNPPDRVVKTKVPARVIAGAVLISVFVIGFILVAVFYSGAGLSEARMRGTVVSKEFRPLPAPERQITIDRQGGVNARTSEGEFIVTVEVPQANGPARTFTVWLNDRARFESLKVGDSFDVGPYIVPSRE